MEMYFKYFKNTYINHITEYFDLQFKIFLNLYKC